MYTLTEIQQLAAKVPGFIYWEGFDVDTNLENDTIEVWQYKIHNISSLEYLYTRLTAHDDTESPDRTDMIVACADDLYHGYVIRDAYERYKMVKALVEHTPCGEG
jgi:hypothetical protein